MAPVMHVSPSTLGLEELPNGLNGESIVISGMSGLFPQSESVNDLSTILYNKINPVTLDNSRWSSNHPEISQFIGKGPNIDRFDSQFFKVNARISKFMDPMGRISLEHTYQAIYDAGLNPKHLNGKKVGVYFGSSFADMENLTAFNAVSKNGYGLFGCNKTMFANRISYWLNIKGPSLSIDTSCCSFMMALEEACSAINTGRCEAAIVGGASLCVAPEMQFHFNRCMKTSPDEKTRSFDVNADGCTKSDAICVLFLQKKKNALRAYAEVVHVKNQFVSKLSGETGQVFGFVRNPDDTTLFLNQFYAEAKVNPHEVEYVEACGTAIPDADKAELLAVEKVFCGNRTDPLLVGSVISNVGYTDAASGATAITKVLLGYHHGKIASNLHCTKPRQDIAALRNGQMRILTYHQPLPCMTYAAVNSLSITGMNSHVLLRGCYKSKDTSRYNTSIPRLVTLSARQKENLTNIFEYLKSRPIDAEELALLHNIHSANITGHLGRGYIILGSNEQQKTSCLAEKKEQFDEVLRPLWFVYSGMGSQWAGMGTQLLRIPIFAAAIECCQKTLEPKGIDIVHIITSPDKSIFDNVLNAFVGIAAIQIGLTDVLTAMGLHPDNIIGHSVGELGCAYADGCLTAEEMILSAYCRGKASNDTTLIRGAMAAVGLGFEQLTKLCPPSIDIACHNSSSSSTISGPEENIREFVSLLTANGVFAKEVPCANIAYHSRYINEAGPTLLHSLSEVIQSPRARSNIWLSTSLPQERWGEPIASCCSPEYLTNNLLSPVLFEETSSLIPSNAVLVEIAPHGLLQAILKRSLPNTCKNVPLTQRHQDNTLHFLDAIGQLYVEGFNPQVQAIYPKVEFPVSTGTPHLAHLVEWYHDESYPTSGSCNEVIKSTSSSKFLINYHNFEQSYLKGNVIQGKVLFPFAGAIMAVWDTLAMSLECLKNKISVKLYDVHLYSQPILHDQKGINLNVSINRGNGQFEVLNGKSKILKGYIVTLVEPESYECNKKDFNKNYVYHSEEIYQHFGSRGYSYRGNFRSIQCVDESLSAAQILWEDNWATLIDGIIQLNILKYTNGGVSQVTQIRELTIDLAKHMESLQQHQIGGKTVLKAEIDEVLDSTRCGGIQIHNLQFWNLQPIFPTVFKLMSPTTPTKNGANDQMSLNKISTNKDVVLQIGTVGNLESLHWAEAPKLSESGIPVTVEYAGINVSDTKRAAGFIPIGNNEDFFGMDFSGLTQCGDRVMGLVRNGAMRSVVTAQPELLWPVPAYWNLEEAATVPLAYVQAFYYLNLKHKLQNGSRVLIHGATGALGQAAISVALAHGCRVFATVATNAKKRFLLRLFPELNEDDIGCSRDTSFADMVLSATNGQGCNLILLSCVQKELKNASMNCMALQGVVVDTSQILNRDEFEYGMFHLGTYTSYITTDFHSIFDPGNQTELIKLQRLVCDGIARGYVRPLSRVVYEAQEAARAFHLLATSRHRGRVLLRMQDSVALAPAQHRIVCSATTSHLIICDASSLGLQLVDMVIARGSKHIHLHCLHPMSQHLLKIRLWKKTEADVQVSSGPLNNKKSITSILGDVNSRGPIEGIYVIAIAAEVRQSNEADDLIGHLDTISRAECPLIKFFGVVTIDNIVGKQVCLSRSTDGLPVTLLNIPAFDQGISNQDVVTDKSSWNRDVVHVLEQALQSKNPLLIAKSQTAEIPSLAKLLAITDNDENSRLKDNIGFTEKMPFIKTFLRDVYHVSLEDEQIMLLTKKELIAIEKDILIKEFEEVNGLHKFFSYVGQDEVESTTELLPLKTLLTGKDKFQSMINTKESVLFIIPGLEGHYGRFKELCKHLKVSAIVLQSGLDYPHDTPQELARRYSKVLLENFKLKRNFYLLGYECGISVALELACILEEHGLTGTLYCLGAGPDEMKSMLETELSSFSSEEALQTGVARHMFSLLAPLSAVPDESALRGCDSWRERVDACVRTLVGSVSHSTHYLRAVLEAAYARVCTQRRYSAEPRALRSQIVLIRACDVPYRAEPSSLQRYSLSPLFIHDLAAPLALAAADLRVPAIINDSLDDHVLEVFNKSNMCETYVLQ